MPTPASSPLLEVAANSIASALAAQEGGAGRIELCTALELGGVTPSYAEIATARDRLTIPLYVLIRPRAGDFLYNDFDCEVMLRDVEACVALGCDGVVLGRGGRAWRHLPARVRHGAWAGAGGGGGERAGLRARAQFRWTGECGRGRGAVARGGGAGRRARGGDAGRRHACMKHRVAGT